MCFFPNRAGLVTQAGKLLEASVLVPPLHSFAFSPLWHLPGDHLQTIIRPERHLQDTHSILRAPSSSFSCTSPNFLPSSFLPPSGSLSPLSFLVAATSSASVSFVCSAGTSFVALRVSPFLRTTAIKTASPFSSRRGSSRSHLRLSRGLTDLFVLLVHGVVPSSIIPLSCPSCLCSQQLLDLQGYPLTVFTEARLCYS